METIRLKKRSQKSFDHGSNMRNDPKIKALRRKYQLTGYMVFTMMLEVLTEAGNPTIKQSDTQIELLAGDFRVEPEILTEIIEYCIALELLTRDETGLYSNYLRSDQKSNFII